MGAAQMIPLPDQFRWDDSDTESPLTPDAALSDGDSADAALLSEPDGEEASADVEDGGEEAAGRPKMSAEEWAEVLSSPDSEQRIAEVPSALRGPVLKAFRAKIETASQSAADLAARSAYEQGMETGRQTLARQLVVQNLDQMDAYERQTYFAANPGSEAMWHQAKAQVEPQQAQPDRFVEDIRDQGRAQLGRLQGHPEYQKVYDEMASAKYPASVAGLVSLTARVERALATVATNDEASAQADASNTARAAKILKAAPKTRGIGAGGAAAGPLTAERITAMSQEEILDYMNRNPNGMEQVARAMQEHSRSLA